MNLRRLQRACAGTVFMLLVLYMPSTGVAQAGDANGLNVSIPVFDTGLPEDASAYAELGVFPRIREIEARYLPYALRRQLAGSGDWGAVRVVANDEIIEELVIRGEILRSDGTLLEIRIRAVDASGATWLDERFSAAPGAGASDPAYERLFAQAAARLDEVRRQHAASGFGNIRDLALLRYGARLAPNTFSQYIEILDDGHVRIRRLPARNDPMLERITRVREAEYVIIDAADEKYRSLHQDVESIYAVWQDFNRKSLRYEAQDEQRIAESTAPGPRGSYEALLHTYENYKFSRLTAQERDSMAVAFDNEVRPILKRLDERLESYDAWLEARYSEWNRLLEELNEVETRLSN